MSVKVDWSKLGVVDLGRYGVRPGGRFNMVTQTEFRRGMAESGVSAHDVSVMLGSRYGLEEKAEVRQPSRALTQSGFDGEFGYLRDGRYMSVDEARKFTPDDVGYCYLRMVVGDQWARVAAVLGPNPRLPRFFSVVAGDLSVSALKNLQFRRIQGALHHVSNGDGSAYEMLRRSLRYCTGAPSVVYDILGVSYSAGAALGMNAMIGGEYEEEKLESVPDDVLEDAIANSKIAIPVVYMTDSVSVQQTVHMPIVDNHVESCLVLPDASDMQQPEAKYVMPKLRQETLIVVPKDVSVYSGGVSVGGRGQSVALVVPPHKSFTAVRSLALPEGYGRFNREERKAWRDNLSALRLRALPLTDRWRQSPMHVSSDTIEGHFALSDVNAFYVHKYVRSWKRDQVGDVLELTELTDPFDNWTPVRETRCTHVIDGGKVHAFPWSKFSVTAVSHFRHELGLPVSAVFNDIVTLIDSDGRFSINSNLKRAAYQVSCSGVEGMISYHLHKVSDAYSYDCTYGSDMEPDACNLCYDSDYGAYDVSLDVGLPRLTIGGEEMSVVDDMD